MATWAFREKNNNNNNNKTESFCRLKFNVHINVDNGESASARMKKKKKKERPISLEETSLFTDFLFSPTSPPSVRDNDKNSGKLNDR